MDESWRQHPAPTPPPPPLPPTTGRGTPWEKYIDESLRQRPPAPLPPTTTEEVEAAVFEQPEIFENGIPRPDPEAQPEAWERWLKMPWWTYDTVRPPMRPEPERPTAAEIQERDQAWQPLFGERLPEGVLARPPAWALLKQAEPREKADFWQDLAAPVWGWLKGTAAPGLLQALDWGWTNVRRAVGFLYTNSPFMPGAYVELGQVYAPGGPLPPSGQVAPGTFAESLQKTAERDWAAAEGFRYTHLVDVSARDKYEKLLIYGDIPNLVLYDQHGRVIEKKNYTPEEAGRLTENVLVEMGFGALLDPLNLIPAKWLAPVAKVVTAPVRLPVKALAAASEAALKKIPQGAWLAELTAQTKAGLAANAAADVVDYFRFVERDADKMLRAFAGDTGTVRTLPRYVQDGLQLARRFLGDEDIVRAAAAMDKAQDVKAFGVSVARAVYTKAAALAEEGNKRVWGSLYDAVKALGDWLPFKVVRSVESAWSAHVLGSRPSWVIFNYTDNFLKTVLEGVSPFRGLADDIADFRAAYGEIPREWFGTFVRTIAGKTEYDVPVVGGGVKEFYQDLLRHVEAQVGGKKNPLAWWQGLNFKLSSDAEVGARLRIGLTKFEEALYRSYRKIMDSVPLDLPPDLRQLVVRELAALRYPNVKEVRELFTRLLSPEPQALRFFNLTVDAADVPNVPGEITRPLYDALRDLAGKGKVTRQEVAALFDRRVADLTQREAEEIQQEVAKHLATIEIPEMTKDILQAVLTPERMKTAEGWLAAYNDLAALPARWAARHEQRLAEVAHASNTLLQQKPVNFTEAVRKLWEDAFQEESKLYERFIRAWKGAVRGFNQQLTKQVGAPVLDKTLLDNLFQQVNQLHKAALRRYETNKLIFSRAAGVADPKARWRLHAQRREINEIYAREATAARMAIQQIHSEANRLLANAPLPHAQNVPQVPFSGTWDVPLDVVEQISRTIAKKYGQIVDELNHWRDVVLANRMRPVVEIPVTADDMKRLGQAAEDIIRQVDGAVTQARQYATEEVNRVLFDYLRTNNFQAVLRHIFPFWRWPTHNLPYYVQALITHPNLVSKLAYYYRVTPEQTEGLPSRLKYSVPVPYGDRLLDAMLGVPSRLYFNPTVFVSVVGQLPTSAYKQRLWQQWYTEEEQPLVGKAVELASQFGLGSYPWWDWLAGFMGLMGDDWYPRNLLPWATLIEFLSNKFGVMQTRDEYGNVVGFNPDTWFRKKVLSLLANGLGWTKGDFTSDRYRIWLLGRNARQEILRQRGYEPDATVSEILNTLDQQKIANNTLAQQLILTTIGHLTGIYGQILTPEDVQEKVLREERKAIDRQYPQRAGTAYRDAVEQFYAEHPEFAAIGNTYSRYPWAETTDELEAKRREAEADAAKADYWKASDALDAQYAKELDAAIRLAPYNRDDHRKVRDAWRQAKQELRDKYLKQFPELDLGWSAWGKTPEEIEARQRRDLLRQVIDTVYPRRAEYVREDGTMDYDAYDQALDYFYSHVWDIVKETPQYQAEKARLLEFGVSGEQADEALKTYFNGDAVQAYFRENDTILEAAVTAFDEFVVRRANEEYQEEIKPQLAAIDKDASLSASAKAQQKKEVMADFFRRYGRLDAVNLIPYVRLLYPDRGWTELELTAAYEGVVFPSIEEVWDANKTGRDKIIAHIWDELEDLSALDVKRVQEGLGDLFSDYFFRKKTRNIDAISDAQLGTWLTALQVAKGKEPDNWRLWLREEAERQFVGGALPESDVRDAATLLVPEPFVRQPGTPWLDVLAGASDEDLDAFFRQEKGLAPWQRRLLDILHPGFNEAMGFLAKYWEEGIGASRRRLLKATIQVYAGRPDAPGRDPLPVAKDNPQEMAKRLGVPEITLATPEESAEYDKARQVNEAAWAAMEAGDRETAERYFNDPLWVKWYGNPPKSLFWRYYQNHIPPGWRSEELTSSGVVAAVLDKGVRAYLSEKAYTDGLEAMKRWVAENPELIVGDPQEWAEVRRQIKEYRALPEGSDARREYWRSHPLLEKYYARPDERARRRPTTGGAGGGVPSAYGEWREVADAAGEMTPVIIGELLSYFGPARQPLSAATKAYLLSLWAKYGRGRTFEDWLKHVLDLWRRYGGAAPSRVRPPEMPTPQYGQTPSGGVRLRVRR